ncbi:MAG: hypothetical protein HY819_16495 [Acidobacteria bacterium]|nr:hypothetical protein [Acidobacteriota bacterium]
MASSLADIHYFFIRLRYTSGLDSLKQWLVGGIILGVLAGIISSVVLLKHNQQRKNFQLFSLIFLRFLITLASTSAIVLAIWNYYKFDYFRLKDAGPIAITVGVILSLWDLASHISTYSKKETR